MARLTGTRESRGAVLFFLAVAAGCGYIVAAKLAGVAQIYVTFVPVALMVGYALLLGLSRSLRLRDDQSGDNLYYLGFLYTLTSLGVSLFQFSTKETAADRIVQNFGIAIATTITGVALRIVFNQMRQDPVEVERLARLELADAARRVRKELDAAVVEFAHSRRATQQVVFEGLDEVAGKVDQVARRIAASLDAVAAKADATVDRSATALTREIESLTAGIGRIAAALERQDRPAGEAGDAVQAARPTLEDLSRRLAAVVDRIEAKDGPEPVHPHDAPSMQGETVPDGPAGNVIRLDPHPRRADEGA